MAPVLPIPGTLTNTTWVAPSGTYIMPNAKTTVHGTVTVDLSAATLIDGGGTVGLLVIPQGTASVDLTVLGGTFNTSTTTAAFVVVGGNSAGAPFTLLIDGLHMTGCPKVLSGGKNLTSSTAYPLSVAKLRNVVATGMTVGVEGIFCIDVDACTLTGGGTNTSPMGLHFAQDGAQQFLWIPGTYLRCTNSTVTGFVSTATAGFRQGDSILAESSCEQVYIDNCTLGHNSDSGGLDCKANWTQISNNIIQSDAGRAISSHTMGNGTGPWNGIRSLNNQIYVNNQFAPDGSTRTEAYQCEGVLEAFNDVVHLIGTGARLAVTAFDDAPGSGAAGSYPRLGTIHLHNVRDQNGVLLQGPLVFGSDASHTTVITIDAGTAADATVTPSVASAPGAAVATPTVTGTSDATVSPSAVAAPGAAVPAVTIFAGVSADVAPSSVDAAAGASSVSAFQEGLHNPDTVETSWTPVMALA